MGAIIDDDEALSYEGGEGDKNTFVTGKPRNILM